MPYLSDFNMYMYILQEGDVAWNFPPACLPREPFLHAILRQFLELFRKFHLASLL